MTSDAFASGQLGPITLRNRIIKAATFEGRTPKRLVTPELIEFHRRFAAGGVGMTTVAYCAVTRAGTTDGHQIVLDDPGHPARLLARDYKKAFAARLTETAREAGATDQRHPHSSGAARRKRCRAARRSGSTRPTVARTGQG